LSKEENMKKIVRDSIVLKKINLNMKNYHFKMNTAQLIFKENLKFEIEDIKLLIKNGINMNRVDKNGMTLLDFACKSNYVNWLAFCFLIILILE
jgi:ankyrin repeat protein